MKELARVLLTDSKNHEQDEAKRPWVRMGWRNRKRSFARIPSMESDSEAG
jgi:hypothetical protein